MIARDRSRVAAAMLVVAAAAGTAAAQSPPADADRVLCEQLGNLSEVKAAVQQTLAQGMLAEATLEALVKRMAEDLNGCSKTPESPSCQPALRSQTTSAIQKLSAQVEDLQTARQAIEGRLKEVDGKWKTFLDQLKDKDSCPHAR
jgi:thymidine phosphorylase